MAIQPSGVAPYAPTSAVLNIIDRYRNHGLAAPFTLEVLQRAGISESLAPRTLQALKLVDLVGEDGNPTEEFTDLSKARSDEYEDRLAAIIRRAYADVFSFVDPAIDPVERVEDAFRAYSPRSQRARMVSLFLGLCRAAGIADATPRRGPVPPSMPRARELRPSKRPLRPSPSGGVDRGAKPSYDLAVGTVGPPALLGLVAQLPEPGSAWTSRQRGNFLNAITATLDMLFEVDDTVQSRAVPEEGDQEI